MQFINIKDKSFGKIMFFLSFFLFTASAYAQSIPYDLEVYGSLEIRVDLPPKILDKILDIKGVYLDHSHQRDHTDLIVNEEAYHTLVETGYDFEIRKQPASKLITRPYSEIKAIKNNSNCLPAIDYYPDYEAYEQMMYDFEEQYPDLCKIINIGELSSGRNLLVAQLGDPSDSESIKPNFFYTSTMHGDEIAGYPLMLQLIDHLLCNYGTDERITGIMNELNIYINPLANPDGTYRGGNHTVEASTRFNSKFVDLNRNFPDPKAGDHPDGREYQEETLFFMDFAIQIQMHMSCNFHGGVEVVNYPWDTFEERHADDDWLESISRDYADTVQFHAVDGYFSDFNNGITNGNDWYEVEGGRQDYHTYFLRGREITIELSEQKRLDSDLLPDFWKYHKNALINYMDEARYGLRGTIRDCVTKEALFAEIVIDDHDQNNSSVFSDGITGNYFRYLAEGEYDVRFISPGYDTVVESLQVIDMSTTYFDVELCPDDMVSAEENFLEELTIRLVDNKILLDDVSSLINSEYRIHDIMGRKMTIGRIVDMSIDLSTLPYPGIYTLVIEKNGYAYSYKFPYLK